MRGWSIQDTHVLSHIARYGLAIICISIALVVTQSLKPTLFPTPLFFAAIVISTWFGGTGPGLFAVLLATVLLNYYYVSRDVAFSLRPSSLVYVAQFAVPAFLTYWVVRQRKFAENALKVARADLEMKVQQRTDDLRQTNSTLQTEIDIRKQAEETCLKTQADLAHLTRVTTMTALATSIAHEVNQPLAAIVTNGDAGIRWLNANPPNLDRTKESIARIVQEGNRAGEIVRRVRSLSSKSTIHKSRLTITDILDDVLALLDGEVDKNGIDLAISVTSDCSCVSGDRIQLQQVALNLVVNAIEAMKYNEPGSKELRIVVEHCKPDRLRFSVCDSGCGIDTTQSDRLFETFFTTKQDGLGMGLSISRTIVEAHGGCILARNNPDRGATFQFELPSVNGSKS